MLIANLHTQNLIIIIIQENDSNDQSAFLKLVYMSQQGQNDELDTMEHYLRTLRKKVQHQLKNPFQIPFAHYKFEELASWKNNILQLDATSRLYGQRVDFLHMGAMQIVSSVLTNQQNIKNQDIKSGVKSPSISQNNPLQKYLQNPEKLNTVQNNSYENISVVWRQICKKRDSLHQLMLNQVTLNKQLRIALFPDKAQSADQDKAQKQEFTSWKLLDFNNTTTKILCIYAQIEAIVGESFNCIFSTFSSHKKQGVADQNFYNSFFQIDLQAQNARFIQEQQKMQCQIDFINNQQENRSPEAQTQKSQQLSSQYSQYLEPQEHCNIDMDRWSTQSIDHQKLKKNKRAGYRRRQRNIAQQFIDFRGLLLTRKEVLVNQLQQQQVDKYLTSKDHLLLRYRKYLNPFRKHKNMVTSKLKIHKQQAFQSNFGEVFQQNIPPAVTNLTNYNSNPIGKKLFKEAALSIKQMKSQIRSAFDLSIKQQQLNFTLIRSNFWKAEPLDIFLTVLHIAAEEQMIINI